MLWGKMRMSQMSPNRTLGQRQHFPLVTPSTRHSNTAIEKAHLLQDAPFPSGENCLPVFHNILKARHPRIDHNTRHVGLISRRYNPF